LLEVLKHLWSPSAVEPNHVALLARAQQIDILRAHHPAIANENHPTKTEPFLKVLKHGLHRCGVSAVALKHMMGNGPAIDHHHPDQHLAIARFVIPTMAMLG
jgi:hypothetical protein